MPPAKPLPEWDRILTAAAHLQELLPDAVLVGGTATAIHADHRVSTDADHILADLTSRFDEVLAQLESVAGWKTARVRRPVQILGSLDGVETGVRQLIRNDPLETEQVTIKGHTIKVPTKAEMLRIKAVLILKRNATRDYIDFVAMYDQLGMKDTLAAMTSFDRLYPQPNGESPTQQLIVQLSSPMPFDLLQTDLTEFKKLSSRWHDWSVIRKACAECALQLAATLRLPNPGKDANLGFGPVRGLSKTKERDQGLEL
jgi:hypothetical protein